MKFGSLPPAAILRSTIGALIVLMGSTSAQETIRVEPSASLSWDKIVQLDRLKPPAVRQQRMIAPYMPEPLESELLPEARRLAPETRTSPSMSRASQQGLQAAEVSATVSGFDAVEDNNTAIPPDTHGAVGPTHLVTMLNSEVRIQAKAGDVLSTVSLSSFWSALGGRPFDPKIIYDHVHARWIATCDANARSDSSKVYFAMSSASDPTGVWHFYAFDADPGDTLWADYPGLGANMSWIAITNNMFMLPPSSSFRGAKMWVIDKSTALAGGVLTVTVFPTKFDYVMGVSSSTLQPCLTFGFEPKLYIVDRAPFSSGGVKLLRLSEISGTGPAPTWSVTAGSTVLPGSGLFLVANNFEFGQMKAPQLGSTALIETNDSRIINAVYRNGKIWCTHSGGLPIGAVDRTAVFWYQLDPTMMAATGSPIIQSGVLDGGAGVHHFFPSISVNAVDDVCVGFSRADATRYVEAVFTMRLGIDPLGTMQQITVLKPGESSYTKYFGGTRNRWGDYSATVVDPSDDMTFWTIQEYADSCVGTGLDDGRWATWWAKIVPSSALPIQLASFAANVVRESPTRPMEGWDVAIVWQTLSETNNYGFEIERQRGENREWQTIGFVKGNGTTREAQSYSLVDRSVPVGKYHYRIKQINLDGKSETFPSMEVNVGLSVARIVLAQNYPNPFNPVTTIPFSVNSDGPASLKVYDLRGRLVADVFNDVAQSERVYEVKLDAAHLASGTYYYELRSAGQRAVKKLVLIK